ncbi:MAG TPA: DUF1841 family protein [Egicoccus sp.]|nr:DUF1841 family protein [Egicoccus sp.]HSK23222.1 DUF1841 family protein [Egicoccus sp.]
MATFDLRPWLTCVDTGLGAIPDADLEEVDADDVDVHDADARALLIRVQHPGLAAAIDGDIDEVVVGGEAVNPRLHLAMHEIVMNQLADDDPSAVRRTARRLERDGHDRHEILHMIAGGVAGELWSTLHDQAPADIDRYIAYLDGLPGTWWEGFDEPDDGELNDDPFELLDPPTGEGPAAALVGAMLDEGVDLTDEAAVGAWIEDFNARPIAERDRLLSDPLGDVGPVPIALPDDATLAAAALATPAMTQLAQFLAWLGDRRPLTQQGNLKLADGKYLVGLLGTDDRFDEIIGGRTFRTQSTTHLFGVDLVYRLAVGSGLARAQGASLRRTRQGTRLAEAFAAVAAPPGAVSADPREDQGGPAAIADADVVLDTWRTVVLEMIRLGMVAGGRPDQYRLRWWEDTLNEGVIDLLTAMLLSGGPLSVDRLVDDALEQLGDDYDLDRVSAWARDDLSESIAWGMGCLVDRLVWLGVATREDVRVKVDLLDQERRLGGQLALTPLGSWFVRPLLIAQGFEVPLAGEFADAGAGELLDAVAEWPPEAFEAEVAEWAADRPTAADELAAVARHAVDPDQVDTVFEALDVLADHAEPAVRALGDDPRCRPFATAWLRNHSLPPLRSDEPADAGLDLVRSLAAVIVTSGPDAAVEAAADEGVDTALVERLWRVDDPWTTPVLEALASGSHKRLSKAARRALFKRRNRN